MVAQTSRSPEDHCISSDLRLETDLKMGLTCAEASRRLRTIGPNEISASQFQSRLKQIIRLLSDPMGLMLLGLATLYALLGDQSDSIVLLIAYIPVTAIDVILELRSNSALAALRSTLHPFAKVLRDGKSWDIPIREIVPGDILIFEEGQSLPADGYLVEAENLVINEAALTGESIPVDKEIGQPFFGGTQVLTGRALGLVQKTGRETRFGSIAILLEKVEPGKSPLKKQVDSLVHRILIVAAVLVSILLGLELLRTRLFVPSLIVALTLGMAAVPEEFPLVFTLYLSLGAWRLSKQRVLVKSLSAVEALGNVDVICTDKTGTLTEGHFQLEDLHSLNFDERIESIWQAALMACEPNPVDSMELAILEKGLSYQPELKDWKLVWDYPFERLGKHMSHVWQRAESGPFRIVMKGAIEGILEHCEVNAVDLKKIESLVQELAGQGKRLLGVASREGRCVGVREEDEKGLRFLGVLAFSDPIREKVKQAISDCQAAGIEIKMLTGDHPLTAHFVADRSGIIHSHDYLFTGDQLIKMTLDQRREAYLRGAIFSRVQPEQKYEMIEALKAAGLIVAMTGDGINDAPALKHADIGISMGHTATDVARSAAQIVLLDSDFSGVVLAMLEGRRILANLKKSFGYLISFHIPVVLLALFPPLFGWPALLLPVHVVVLELIVHPVSAYTFEGISNQKEVEPPRSIGKASTKLAHDRSGLIGRIRLIRALLAGTIMSACALILFRLLFAKYSIDYARTAAFSVILCGNIAFVLNEMGTDLNWNGRFFGTAVLLLGFVLVLSFVPIHFLHFIPVGLTQGLWSIALASLALLPRFVYKRSLKIGK